MVKNSKGLKNNLHASFFMLFILFFAFTNACYAGSKGIGKIDLAIALTLHPKMSLFDYSRLAFYKVELGLSDMEFSQRVFDLENNSPDRSQEINAIKQKINVLMKKKIKMENEYYKADSASSNENLDYINQQLAMLRVELKDIEFSLANQAFTNVEETQKILKDISDDVESAIGEVAREQNLCAVLNNSVSLDFNLLKGKNTYPNAFLSREAFKKDGVLLFEHSYYAYLTEAKNSSQLPGSSNLSNWLETVRSPTVVDILPVSPQPFAILGANDILIEVLRKIYAKYNISPTIWLKIEKVLTELNIKKSTLFNRN